MPDAPAAATFEPIPHALAGEIVGLLEYLDARGGREDVFRIASDTNREFGVVIPVVDAAELLDFVDTPKRMVVLDAEGRRFVKADPEERKTIWRDQIMKLSLFSQVHDALQRDADHRIDRDFVLETIVMRMPLEDYQRVFDVFIGWARFGNLFAYDEDDATISLQ